MLILSNLMIPISVLDLVIIHLFLSSYLMTISNKQESYNVASFACSMMRYFLLF